MRMSMARKDAGHRRFSRIAVVTAATVVLTAGAAAGPALASSGSTPPLLPAQTITDVAYTAPVPATTKGNLLDLYLPERTSGKPIPLFIFTEGSAWFADNGKSTAGAWAAQLNPRGYAVAGVSVRSSLQTQFPGQLYDIKSAIRYLRAHAADWGIDPDRFALGGFSSGAWTAAIAGVTGDAPADLEGDEGVTGVSSRVQAVVTFSAPVAFRLMDGQATQYSILQHGTPNSPESLLTGCTAYPTGIMDDRCTKAEQANPINYVTPDDPPFLMFHGTHDQLLPPAQSQVLFDALSKACVDAEFHLVDGPDHQYAYIQKPGQPPVTGQTVSKVDPATCGVSTTEGLTPESTPSYDLVASFLDRALVPAWDKKTVYDAGDRVTYDGHQFVAQWWTQNETPGASPWSSWEQVGDATVCADGAHRAWTASQVYTGGETVVHGGAVWKAQWWTRNEAPGASQWGPWSRVGTC